MPNCRALLLAILTAAGSCLPSSAQQESAPVPPPPPGANAVPATEAEAEATSEATTAAEVKALLEALSADDFRAREDATVRLWGIGESAEPLVREAAKSGDIEVRTRAAHLLALFKFGIYPDTSPEVVALINQFRYGSQFEQIGAIKKLYSDGAMETVIRLIRSVSDQATRKRLVSEVIEELDGKLAELFAAGEFDRVEALLGLAAISDEGLRDLAAFHLQRGSIDAQIATLRTKENETKLSPIDYEQLSWFYRVKGDLDQALIAADSSGNAALGRDIRIAQGDLLTLIKSSYNPNDRTIQTYGFNAAAQRLSGDFEGLDTTVETIKKYAVANPAEAEECARALLINGRIAEAIEVSTKGSSDRIQLLIDNGDHAMALAELGITKLAPPYDEWLDSVSEQFSAAETPQEYGRSLSRANTLARLLVGWGELEEAERIFDRLGQIASGLDPDFMSSFIANASDLGLHEIALKFTRSAFAKEAADAEPAFGLQGQALEEERVQNRIGRRDAEDSLISALYYNEAATAGSLWGRLESRFPNETSLERLDRMETILAPIPAGAKGIEAKAAARAAIESLRPRPSDAIEGEEKADTLEELADLHLRFDDREAAMALVKLSLEIAQPNNSNTKLKYSGMLAADGRWQEAAELLKPAIDELGSTPYHLYYLVRYGIALERAGQAEEAARVIGLARLQALGRPIEHILIAAGFASYGEYDRARGASQMAINIASLDDPSVHAEALRLSNYLVYDEPARAAQLKERYLVECLNGHLSISNITSASSIRGMIGSLEARIAIEEGRTDDAIDLLRRLVDQQPSNSSLIEDLYPLLVEAGRDKEADEFYQKLNQYGEDALALFPDSMQDLNSNAWLKARCGKDLDTALQRSERSNELSKNNEAYLDTLAEVHFQRGDRSKAVEISEKAVKLSENDFLLNHQLQRFKDAQPLSERLGK